MRKFLEWALVPVVCLSVSRCAMTTTTADTAAAPPSAAEPMRYPAWLEGDYQNSYRADRKAINEKLEKWSKSPPSPSDTDDYLEYLSVLDAAGRTKEAGDKIRKFLKDNPKETRAAFLLAIHSLRTGNRELAEYFFGKLEKDPSFPWKSMLYNNLGMLALKDGDRYRAISMFEKAANSKPPIAAPHVNLGSLYLRSGNYKEAEKAFFLAVKLDEDFEDAVLGWGSALEALGQFEKAQAAYADFLSRHPDALSVIYNNAILLGNRLNRKQEAAELMLKYVRRGGKETAKAQELIQNWR